MKSDRSETNDLALKYPVMVEELEQIYREWAERVDVVEYNKILNKRQ